MTHDWCRGAYRIEPMPGPAFCYEDADHSEIGTSHRGRDGDGHYYTWFSTDEGAYEVAE